MVKFSKFQILEVDCKELHYWEDKCLPCPLKFAVVIAVPSFKLYGSYYSVSLASLIPVQQQPDGRSSSSLLKT
jgi:hypothetical protein